MLVNIPINHGHKPIRNDIGYEYFYDGKSHKYYPDFILYDTIYEIKGYETKKDKLKYESVKDKKLIVLKKKDLIDIFDYIDNTYSKDYVSLYDMTKHTNYSNPKDLCKCGSYKNKQAKKCKKCYLFNRRKVKNRPSYEQLLKDIKETNYTKTGEKYGVSDNTIRKWIKFYEKIKLN